MNNEALQRAREAVQLAGKATVGPWVACTWDPMERPHAYARKLLERHNHGGPDLPYTHDDSRFIAAARQLLPALATDVERLVGEAFRQEQDRRSLIYERDEETKRAETAEAQVARLQGERDYEQAVSEKHAAYLIESQAQVAALQNDLRFVLYYTDANAAQDFVKSRLKQIHARLIPAQAGEERTP